MTMAGSQAYFYEDEIHDVIPELCEMLRHTIGKTKFFSMQLMNLPLTCEELIAVGSQHIQSFRE
jgi:hypothetical protein